MGRTHGVGFLDLGRSSFQPLPSALRKLGSEKLLLRFEYAVVVGFSREVALDRKFNRLFNEATSAARWSRIATRRRMNFALDPDKGLFEIAHHRLSA